MRRPELLGVFAAALRIARVFAVPLVLQFKDSESRGRLRRRPRR